jgi:hypothetical protein
MRLRFSIAGLLCLTLVAALAAFCLSPEPAGIQVSLVDFDIIWQFDGPPESMPLSNLIDDSAVLISDADILSYNWGEHSITISGAALDRLPRRGEFSVSSQYFLLSVNAEPCYLGSIETKRSSDSKRLPTILVDDLPARGGGDPATIPIIECYPAGMFAVPFSVDKRYNERLKRFLKKTGRLDGGG